MLNKLMYKMIAVDFLHQFCKSHAFNPGFPSNFLCPNVQPNPPIDKDAFLRTHKAQWGLLGQYFSDLLLRFLVVVATSTYVALAMYTCQLPTVISTSVPGDIRVATACGILYSMLRKRENSLHKSWKSFLRRAGRKVG